MNITYEKNVYYSFIIFTLNNLAQFDDCFCSLNIATRTVEKLEEGPQTETTTSEINRLKQRQINQKIKIRVTGLKAEKVADDRDAILAKDCRLHN
ncbi:unnamed protein product [Rotaria socialis]